MEIRLRFPASPEHAAAHAELAAKTIREKEGVELDFTPASLVVVEEIIERFRKGGATADGCCTTLFLFGCYLGEVLVRNTGAQWVATNSELAAMDDWPMFVRMPWGTFCNPLRKPFKRLEHGQEDSLTHFYQVFSRPKQPE